MSPGEVVLGVVGPCASGKTTLVAALRALNYQVRHIAQEHSYVQDMWQRIGNPDLLIYLDVSFEESVRRTGTTWTRDIFEKQIYRLRHAHENADMYIQTDNLTPQQVLEKVLDLL
jgi:deoxyadenosine/deoxycytidine kinase